MIPSYREANRVSRLGDNFLTVGHFLICGLNSSYPQDIRYSADDKQRQLRVLPGLPRTLRAQR